MLHCKNSAGKKQVMKQANKFAACMYLSPTWSLNAVYVLAGKFTCKLAAMRESDIQVISHAVGSIFAVELNAIFTHT